MIKSVTQRLIRETIRKTFVNYVGNKRFASSKDDKSSPLCAPPPQPPFCPSNPPEPPPCPPPPPPCGPPCPPPICTAVPDPNNPCNYVPPANPDPDEPDMTRVKRLQCLYQQDDGIPIHLKGGRHNVYLFHILTIIGGISLLQTMHDLFMMTQK